MTATRRPSAILAVDVVGYSRLMGEDEARTARAVSEHRERHVRYSTTTDRIDRNGTTGPLIRAKLLGCAERGHGRNTETCCDFGG
jgi:hypothetical protein